MIDNSELAKGDTGGLGMLYVRREEVLASRREESKESVSWDRFDELFFKVGCEPILLLNRVDCSISVGTAVCCSY